MYNRSSRKQELKGFLRSYAALFCQDLHIFRHKSLNNEILPVQDVVIMKLCSHWTGVILHCLVSTDMQKVEILPPADFQVKISAKGQNQTLLLGFMNFRQFS